MTYHKRYLSVYNASVSRAVDWRPREVDDVSFPAVNASKQEV